MSAFAVVRDAVLGAALAPFAFYVFALIAARGFFRGPAGSALKTDYAPPVSILKPIHGFDRETYENFASFCRQDYPEFEILFCVSDADDPAVPTIEKIIGDFPGRPIRLLIGAEPVGASDKVNKLCRMAREARHDILVVSDSDVRVEAGFLREVAGAFADPKAGGVTCLYRGLTDDSFAANLEALGNSADFAPGVLVARLLGGVNFMLGAVMATTRERLAEIGGFEALADYFSDDYELGNRIAAGGHRIELARRAVGIVYPRQTLAEAIRHQLRWNLSIRFSRPMGHAGMIFSMGLPWAALAAAVAPRGTVAAEYLAGYLVLRTWVAWQVGVVGMNDPLVANKLWMLPIRDAFAFLVWVASFFPQRIHWRGREFFVREKRLVAAPPRG
ncbi:MAG TPA: bacteriohopanetetrol glucosamine biosynthesis glycosyltransferase HpnI [Verrucomicrobiae bacterium]|nr:bacteriohopanetetrol glucosamine biosynthesis glycosyltransferase HpnI [Verrucomicrobiae bacterium]